MNRRMSSLAKTLLRGTLSLDRQRPLSLSLYPNALACPDLSSTVVLFVFCWLRYVEVEACLALVIFSVVLLAEAVSKFEGIKNRRGD